MKSPWLYLIVCLVLVLGLAGCAAPEESPAATASPPPTTNNAEVKEPASETAVPLDNTAAVVPYRDPFQPLVVASASGEDTGSSGSVDQSSERQDPVLELVSVYQETGLPYASLQEGDRWADVTISEIFNGYKVIAIDVSSGQVTLEKDGQTRVLKMKNPSK